jgi:hypothetical protein
MKALQMLEHVCLHEARAFVRFLLAVACLSLLSTWSYSSRHDFLQHDTFWLLAASLWIILWSICIRNLRSLVTRCCLGISSGLLFSYWALSDLELAPGQSLTHHNMTFSMLALVQIAQLILIIGIPLLGFGSMLWVSIRPPQISNPSDPHSHENHPLPQSC